MSPADVLLSPSPWIGGTRLDGTYGPISATIYATNGWIAALEELMECAKAQAAILGGNVVLGYEISIEPFDTLECTLTGTAAHLVYTDE